MSKRHVVEVPGATGRVEVVEAGIFSGVEVLVDGQRVRRKGLMSPLRPIPTSNGPVDLDVRADPLRGGLVVKGGGLDLRLGETYPMALGILAFLPFVLVGVGGAIGGAMGGVGWAINLMIARSTLPMPVRAAAMIGVTFAAAAVWFVLAGSLSLMFSR